MRFALSGWEAESKACAPIAAGAQVRNGEKHGLRFGILAVLIVAIGLPFATMGILVTLVVVKQIVPAQLFGE